MQYLWYTIIVTTIATCRVMFERYRSIDLGAYICGGSVVFWLNSRDPGFDTLGGILALSGAE
jgi:hypothetical protein